MAEIGGNGQGVVPIASAVAAVGNRVSNRHNVSDNGDNQNDIEEVIHKNNDHHEFPVITGRLGQLAYRQ